MRVLIRILIFVIALPLLLSYSIATGINAKANDLVDDYFPKRSVDLTKLNIVPEPTIIYDKNGDELSRFVEEKKDVTSYDEIPLTIIEAVISTEDRAFFEHPGINVKAIARALIEDIKARAFVQGGSTLTQQLVKTVYLHPGKTLERKRIEAIEAFEVERLLDKKEIIAHYLNHIFYGHDAYGIRSAVETYFGQTLEEFKADSRVDQIVKASLLAGLPQAPSDTSPYLNPEKAKDRRNVVITNLFNEGFITKEEYEEAIQKPFLILDVANVEHEDEVINYPEFIHYALSEAAIKLGISDGPIDRITEQELKQTMYSGVKIHTSFDKEVYGIIRKHMERDELFPSNAKDGTKVQGSMAIVNPQNGEIYAMAGGRDEITKFLDFSRAFQMKRQPGSAFKPIVSYGPALETGEFEPYSLLAADHGHRFPGGYVVKDHGSGPKFKTMLASIYYSNNVPAVWMLEQVGLPYAKEYSKKLGIDLSNEDSGLSTALGGLQHGVSPLQMADAYQAFANGGKRAEAHTIRKMISYEGKVIYEPEKPVQVIKKENADIMRYMLRGVVTSGTGTRANVYGHYISGKTGTTEVPWKGHRGNKDIWFVGMTKDYVGAVWMGYDKTDREHYLNDYSSTTAGFFGEVIKELVQIKGDPSRNYRTPKNIKPDVKDMTLDGRLVTTDFEGGGNGNIIQNHEVRLTWEKEENTLYKIYRNGEVVETEISKDAFKDTSFTPGESYTYKVVGYSEYGNFRTFETNSFTVKIPLPPEPEMPEIPEEEPEESNDPPVEENPSEDDGGQESPVTPKPEGGNNEQPTEEEPSENDNGSVTPEPTE